MAERARKFLLIFLGTIIIAPLIIILVSIPLVHASYYLNNEYLSKSMKEKRFDEICIVQSYSPRRDAATDNFYITIDERHINIGKNWSYWKEGDGIHTAIFIKDNSVNRIMNIKTTDAMIYLKDKNYSCLNNQPRHPGEGRDP